MKRACIFLGLFAAIMMIMLATPPPAQAANHLNKVTITAAQDNTFTAGMTTSSSVARADQQTLNSYTSADLSRSSPGIFADNLTIGANAKNADGSAITASEYYDLTWFDTDRYRHYDNEYFEGATCSGRFSGAAVQRHL